MKGDEMMEFVNNNSLYLLILTFVIPFVLLVIYRYSKIRYEFDTSNIPKKEIIDYRKNSIQHAFPGVLLDWPYLFSRITNYILHIFAKKSPISILRVLMHRLRGVTIGRNVVIWPNVSIDPAFPSLVFIENDVVLGHNTIIIAHSIPPYSFKKIMPSYTDSVVIESDSWIGINVIIFPGVRIGQGSLVIAGSVVDSDVEPHTIVRGNPAIEIGKLPSKKD